MTEQPSARGTGIPARSERDRRMEQPSARGTGIPVRSERDQRVALAGYPVNLLVRGRRCVVVGGGRIAARKVEALLEAGALVHVVAPELGPELQAWAQAGRVSVAERPFEPADLDEVWLATAATSDPAVNQAVFEAGEARRVWVNAADDPAHCSFTLMAILRRGDLVVSIGTGGRSPGLATYLKEQIATELGPEWTVLLDLVSEAREEIRAEGRSSESVDWHQALDSGMLDLIRAGRTAEAKELLQTCLSSSSD